MTKKIEIVMDGYIDVLAEKLDITSRAVKKNIKELSEQGILERVGSARNGYWKITE